jgi:hypothetical protein
VFVRFFCAFENQTHPLQCATTANANQPAFASNNNAARPERFSETDNGLLPELNQKAERRSYELSKWLY